MRVAAVGPSGWIVFRTIEKESDWGDRQFLVFGEGWLPGHERRRRSRTRCSSSSSSGSSQRQPPPAAAASSGAGGGLQEAAGWRKHRQRRRRQPAAAASATTWWRRRQQRRRQQRRRQQRRRRHTARRRMPPPFRAEVGERSPVPARGVCAACQTRECRLGVGRDRCSARDRHKGSGAPIGQQTSACDHNRMGQGHRQWLRVRKDQGQRQ